HIGADYTPGTLTNSATVSSANDANTANDTDDAKTAVSAKADLAVKKTASGPAIAGQDETYTIIVHNNGPSDAGAYTVTDALPANTTFVPPASSGCTTN